jgi:hypothetical protein
VEREKGNRKEENQPFKRENHFLKSHPSTLARGLLNGISYTGLWRRGRVKRRRKIVLSKILKASLLYQGSLSCRSF